MLQSKFLSQVVLNIGTLVLNITGLISNMTAVVLNITEIVLNMTGFDFFFNHMGPAQPSLLV